MVIYYHITFRYIDTSRHNFENFQNVFIIDFFHCFFFSDQFLRTHMPLSELVFKGEFVVVEGDFLPQGAVQIGSLIHVQKSRFYQHKLDLIFSGSSLATKYLHNEVFLLEG